MLSAYMCIHLDFQLFASMGVYAKAQFPVMLFWK